MTEREMALKMASRVLDKHDLDPDGDLCLLARQFLRVSEGALNAVNDQIKYCSNGAVHVTAKRFLDTFPSDVVTYFPQVQQ